MTQRNSQKMARKKIKSNLNIAHQPSRSLYCSASVFHNKLKEILSICQQQHGCSQIDCQIHSHF